jgi:hypothetical protein
VGEILSTAGEISGAKRRDPFEKGGRFERGDDDWFVEPAWTVEVLAIAEGPRLLEPIWDPACGGGCIPITLARCGFQPAIGTDLVDRGFGPCMDFLGATPQTPSSVWPQSIVCNPPYNLAEAFVRRAVSLVPYVAMLVQAKFPYSQGRHRLFTQHPPARLYFLSDRPSMPPGALLRDGKIKAKGGKMDFCWIVWDKRSPGPTTAHWIRKPAGDRPHPSGRRAGGTQDAAR